MADLSGEGNKTRPEAQSPTSELEHDAASEPSPSAASPHHGHGPLWFQGLKDWSPSLVLENTGSVARDHLASERTWLAYIRTSLAISSAGVALVQLFTIAASRSPTTGDRLGATIQKWARPIGATSVLIGLGVCLLGFVRYFVIQHALTKGKFPTARLEVHAVSILLALMTGVIFGVLCAVPR